MKKYDIVITRFNEDVSWVNQLDSEKYNVLLYNKGEDDINYPHINRPNIGREAETMVSYIIENYDNLPEFVVFLQGNPFEHCKNVIEIINDHIGDLAVALSKDVIWENIAGWYELYSVKDMPFSEITRLRDIANILLEDVPEEICFVTSAQFILSRDIIYNRSKEYYKMLLDMLMKDRLMPWHLERLWLYIWQIGIE
jgi:hypothetical protein